MNLKSSDDIKVFVRKLIKSDLGFGRNIISLSTYNQITMWWMSNLMFYNHIQKNINDLSSQNNLKYGCIDIIVDLVIYVYSKIGIFVSGIYFATLCKITKIISYIYGRRNAHYSTFPAKGKVLFITQDNQWRLVKNELTRVSYWTDIFFDSVIKELKKENYDIIGTYRIDMHPIRGLKVFISKLNLAEFRYMPLEFYWDPSAWYEEKNSFKLFRKNWIWLKNCKMFKKLIDSTEAINNNIISREMSIYFYVLYPNLVRVIKMARKLIKIEEPDVIILLNEFGYWERAIIAAAKMEGIPTIALQHGAITLQNLSYSYTRDEIDINLDFRAPFCPLPDKTLVYGPRYRDMLTNLSSYPPHSVVVTGQPRYDYLIELNKNKKSLVERIKKDYPITKHSKIILWAPAFHDFTEFEMQQNCNCVLGALERLENTTLLIKPHPNDGPKQLSCIKKYIRQSDLSIILLPSRSDTNLLLLISDLMITKNSTTAIEALLLGKPVIVLNLSGQPDIVDYVIEGVAKGVYGAEELFISIKELFNENFPKEDVRERYLDQYICGLDGNATQNVIREIELCLSNSGKTKLKLRS